MPNILAIAVLAVAYALADRFAGGGWPELDKKLLGRAAFWGALVCAGLGFLMLGLGGALGGLAWLIYRTPGWRVFGGSATPVGAREIAGTFARHLIAAPLVALVAYWAGHEPLKAAICMGAFAAVGTVLAVQYGAANEAAANAGQFINKRINERLELIRGAAFGVALALAI
jgi:hypothetical protein